MRLMIEPYAVNLRHHRKIYRILNFAIAVIRWLLKASVYPQVDKV